ncbi:MAG: hypothetical protein KGR17_04305 [Acidobacteria bacterium]|nr:hypothetical protein [Acidobacteriota bacterium]
MIRCDHRTTLIGSAVDDRECTVKKGRHRRYEEARALKRGPDLDIEGILDDLSSDRDDRPGGDPDDFDVLRADSDALRAGGTEVDPEAATTDADFDDVDDEIDDELDDEIPA